MILSMTTLSMTTIGIMTSSVMLSVVYAEWSVYFVKLSVIMLNGIMLSVMAPTKTQYISIENGVGKLSFRSFVAAPFFKIRIGKEIYFIKGWAFGSTSFGQKTFDRLTFRKRTFHRHSIGRHNISSTLSFGQQFALYLSAKCLSANWYSIKRPGTSHTRLWRHRRAAFSKRWVKSSNHRHLRNEYCIVSNL
jgi:hypothetical protein